MFFRAADPVDIQHPKCELPQVREEICQMMLVVEQDVATKGEDRLTLTLLRMFLSRVAMQFHNLTMSALNITSFEHAHPLL